MRLLVLYLRSRLAGWAALTLAASVPIIWFWLRHFGEVGAELTLSLVVIPLMPAVVIGASTRSPFGEAERTASRALSVLRCGHLAGLLLCGALVLRVASLNTSATIEWELIRNLAGFTGLALFAARILGSGIAWIIPLGYGALALMLSPTSRWAWPARFPIDNWSTTAAITLVTIGLVVMMREGARETPGEYE